MGALSKQFWNYADYGDVSNSENSNDLPVCNHTYVLFNLNYGRGLGEVLEDHTHHIEAIMRHIRPNLWSKFVGECGEQETYACGWTHYPPNVMRFCEDHDYEWYSQEVAQSNCADWQADGSGVASQVSCDTWNPGCQDDSGVGFKRWWMQNIPDDWWLAVGDFDTALTKKNNN